MSNIVIIDYDCGNILSLKRALNKINLNCKLSREINEISNATHLILPELSFWKRNDPVKKI